MDSHNLLLVFFWPFEFLLEAGSRFDMAQCCALIRIFNNSDPLHWTKDYLGYAVVGGHIEVVSVGYVWCNTHPIFGVQPKHWKLETISQSLSYKVSYYCKWSLLYNNILLKDQIFVTSVSVLIFWIAVVLSKASITVKSWQFELQQMSTWVRYQRVAHW